MTWFCVRLRKGTCLMDLALRRN